MYVNTSGERYKYMELGGIELHYTEVTRWLNSPVYSSLRDASWAAESQL